MTPTITGLDLVALVLLGHIWAVFVALAVHAETADPDPESGARWAGRRFALGTRQYAGALLLATVVVWLPFAVGDYPFWPATADSGTVRGAFFATVLGGIAIGGGVYLLAGGIVAAVTSYRLRREGPTAIGAVDDGLVSVSGTVVPATSRESGGGAHTTATPLSAPLTGTQAVWYRLTATDTGADIDSNIDSDTDTDTATSPSPSSRLSNSITTRLGIGTRNKTHRLECDHVPFTLEDDTGQIRIDPAHAAVALESTTTQVRASETPPDRLAAWLRDARYADDVDQDRTYYETVLEPDAEVTIVGIARPQAADLDTTVAGDVATDGVGIAARNPSTELFIENGPEQTALARAWFRGTAARGVLWGLVAIAAGSAVLWWMTLTW
ncbi:outer membrane autotransporter barrel [Natrialba hulunbeirensis JCM 10989]|uniref:RING-type E3 ubiquitin transferase n=1 Tax=Natrialba hulunbeirensis JCM 10989 TaxID=1227493 RepID=M0AA65_9EURY|nr:GIDE domain-containing protein [Natrialba hulunbeirensis]ELY94223.1 outer membrane autotransporter barrel [Natrialba hulunbeirensis JCM 10989]